MKSITAAVCLLVFSMSACGGGGSNPVTSSVPNGTKGSSSGAFASPPVQLTVDPCSLVTKSEAEAVIGSVNTPSTGSDGTTCVYVSSKNTGGQISVGLQAPAFCKLLFLALDKDMFGGQQVRVDDVGDGGMQVKGNGNVQFVAKGGCVEVDGRVDRDTMIDDNTILGLAKVAAGRVS